MALRPEQAKALIAKVMERIPVPTAPMQGHALTR